MSSNMSLRLPSIIALCVTSRAPHGRPCLYLHFFSTIARPSSSSMLNRIPWPVRLHMKSRDLTNVTSSPVLGFFRNSLPRSQLSLHRRPFSTSGPSSLRQSYFPNRSGRPNGSRPGFWRRWRDSIDSYPPMFIVCLTVQFLIIGFLTSGVKIYGLIGLNVGIFLLWQYAFQSWVCYLLSSQCIS